MKTGPFSLRQRKTLNPSEDLQLLGEQWWYYSDGNGEERGQGHAL